MKTALRQGEQVVKEGAANLQKVIESVGGRLCLTNRRLIFEAHRFNVQTGTTEVELSDIQSSRPCWALLLGLVPVWPNALVVLTKQGSKYRFTVWGRHAWIAEIEAQQRAE